MKHAFLVAVFISVSAFGQWTTEEIVDEMTDQKIVLISAKGSEVDGMLNYRPELIIRLKPTVYNVDEDELITSCELILSVEDGLKRSGVQILTRIDSETAQSETWLPSTTRRAAFCPKPLELVDKLRNAKTFRIRYSTTLGETKTTTFDLEGLDAAFTAARDKAKKEVPAIKTKPEPEPETPHAEKKESFEERQARVIEKVKSYVVPKLKTKTTFKPGTVDIRELNGVTLWVVHFAADKRKWRMGVKEFADGRLEIVQPSQLSSLIENRYPSH